MVGLCNPEPGMKFCLMFFIFKELFTLAKTESTLVLILKFFFTAVAVEMTESSLRSGRVNCPLSDASATLGPTPRMEDCYPTLV